MGQLQITHSHPLNQGGGPLYKVFLDLKFDATEPIEVDFRNAENEKIIWMSMGLSIAGLVCTFGFQLAE